LLLWTSRAATTKALEYVRLSQQNALKDFDPYPMVLKAAGYLLRHGPVTQQEQWEEASGYSPSTLASNIAAFIAAA
jgi:glucoamylase